ncbi:unnamed protein product [Tilletia controversa]|uniref:Uncharacterized protein n=1 Tax=Tilletia controversa TaxID=13291 RepID=A0A8X7MXE0_9BASI|nr:hypothetical protein CF328_g3016 [Tilletia controversa]KAE8252818.1 hypothetical protein A4X06_0g1904 [Tilletia controversa]CAD6903555.1 unnamed protein product [Tilletia controversa]
MNALQATFDLIPSSPTLQSIGTCAVSGWGSLTAAMSFTTQQIPSPLVHDEAAVETQGLAPNGNEAVVGQEAPLMTRIRSHSCSSASATPRDLSWLTSPVPQTQLPSEAVPRSKSYTASLSDSPRSSVSSPGKPVPPAHINAPSPSLAALSPSAHPPRTGSVEAMAFPETDPVKRLVKAGQAAGPDVPTQRPASRASILASASRAMTGSPRLGQLAPVHENDDIEGGLMLPPPRFRTMTMRSNTIHTSSTTAASTTTTGQARSRHTRSQSASTLLGPMSVLGLMERNKATLGTSTSTSPKKAATTTAVSAVVATCLDNIDGRAAEQQTAAAPQFRNPFAPAALAMPSSMSGRSIHTLQGGIGSSGSFSGIPTSATMPDLSSVLASESLIFRPPARIRTVSSCSNKMSMSSVAHCLPVSNSGVIELQPHASYFTHTPSSSRPWLQVQPGSPSKSNLKPPFSPNSRLDPIFNTVIMNESVAARSLGRSGAGAGTGPRRANSLPRGYLPQYKEFREPVPASIMNSPRSAQVHYEQQQQSQNTPTGAYHSNRLATMSTWDASLPIHTLTQSSPTRSSFRRTQTLTSASSSSKRTELLMPIDTELANRKRRLSSKQDRTTSSATYESSSPAGSFLDLPPLSACTTSSASSCSSGSADERIANTPAIRRHTPTSLFFEEKKSAKFPSSTMAASSMGRAHKHSGGSANLAIPAEMPRFSGRERERLESLAYVRAREPFPLETHDRAHSWRLPSSPKKGLAAAAFETSTSTREFGASSLSAAATAQSKGAERVRRPSSLSSSLSFLVWPSGLSSSSIATRTDRPGSSGFTLPDSEASESGFSGWRRRGQAGFSAVVDSGSEDGDDDGEGEDEQGEGMGWSSYVSMQDVHSPIMERSPVFNTAALRPALSRGQSSVPVL